MLSDEITSPPSPEPLFELQTHQRLKNIISGWSKALELSDKVLSKIFSYVSERDLCRLAQANRRFHAIANDGKLWMDLYRRVYEYDLPLIIGSNPGEAVFVETRQQDASAWSFFTAGSKKDSAEDFPGMRIEPCFLDKPSDTMQLAVFPSGVHAVSASGDSPTVRNIWQESFRRLRCAVHIRQGYEVKAKRSGQQTKYFDRIEQALRWCDGLAPDYVPLILIHSGTYRETGKLLFKRPFMMLGCGPGRNPAENVIIRQCREEGSFIFSGKSGRSYLGYLTLISGNVPENDCEYCISVCDDADPVIEHCRVQSFSETGAAIVVRDNAEPLVRHCDLPYSKHIGILVTDKARGLYEKNRISRTSVAIRVHKDARPALRSCKFQGCRLGRVGRQHLLEDY